jgi:hypothetical protein
VETVTIEVEGTKEEVTVGDSEKIRVPISFPIPLGGALASTSVHYQTDADFATFCDGTAAVPKVVNSGELCVYQNAQQEAIAGSTFEGIFKPGSAIEELGRGANRAGATLLFSEPTADAHGSGTFAVKG